MQVIALKIKCSEFGLYIYWNSVYQEKLMIKKAIVEYEKAVDLSGSTPLVLAALATV